MKMFRLLAILLLVSPVTRAANPAFEIRAVAEHPGSSTQEYLQMVAEGNEPKKVYLERETLLGLAAVCSASAVYVDDDRWTVRLSLTNEGSDRIAEITTKHLGKRIAFLINEKLFSFGTVHAIVKGGLDIGTDLPADAAFSLAAELNAAVARAAAVIPSNP